jgi:hypothetical protein
MRFGPLVGTLASVTLSLSLSLSLLASTAFASTWPIFGRNGKQGTVLLRGAPGDLDASDFYNLLTAPPVEDHGKWTKKVAFKAPDGVQAFTAVCAYSKMIANNGSCVLIMRLSEGVTIGSGRMTYRVTGDTAAALAKLFAVTPNSHEIYRSKDGRFTMNVEVNSSSKQVSLFLIEYR